MNPNDIPTLKIKSEFQKLIPPLSDYEKTGLEEEIKYWGGCYSPIIIWKGFIADGHHRYAICQKLGISFKTEELCADGEIAVKRWMINNQFKRRNLLLHVKLDLAFEDEELEQEEAKQRMLAGKKADPSKLVYEGLDAGRVLEKVGKKAGCSHQTAYQYKKIKAAGLRDRVVKGESIKKVYRELQKEEKLETLKTSTFPQNKYRVIYADPPWQYNDNRPPGNGGAVDHYPTMPLEEICKIPIQDLAEENSVLFLWATTPLLQEGLDVLKAWGFTYKTLFTWDKEQGFYGNYNSVAQEFLLLGTKGSCLPDCDIRPYSVIREKKGRHSEKPERFRELIEGMYKYGNKLELFARKKTEGWEVYGNEI